ncbi:MAG: hypothetical protein J0I47_06140 [Sphingomonas sp.]|uniref:hypothetical protein n=1 Tax=Sphingomonas sp. TaxID=28214 RepID=UPI001ACF1D2B|nr:hypothetical protein [Sphingomonas sp.]MBN8807799.1 hypothetical protein [Sphingomonas sp.]
MQLDRANRKELRRAGYALNIAEFEAAHLLKSAGIEFSRRGYPDYAILRDGEIAGFVEVKPTTTRALRDGQKLFRDMCGRFGIPFLKWSPDEGSEALLQFVANLS